MSTTRSYLVVDTETNGLPQYDKRGNANFDRVHPVEIGVLRVVAHPGGGILEETPWSRLVRLPAGVTMSPEAADLHGITSGELEASGVEFADAMFEIEQVSGPATTIVGQNVLGFDLHLLRRSKDPVWHFAEIIDTKLLWVAWTHGRRKGKHEGLDVFWGSIAAIRSSSLSSLEHIEQTLLGVGAREIRHRALADCIACAAVYEAMVSRGIVAAVLGETFNG